MRQRQEDMGVGQGTAMGRELGGDSVAITEVPHEAAQR